MPSAARRGYVDSLNNLVDAELKRFCTPTKAGVAIISLMALKRFDPADTAETLDSNSSSKAISSQLQRFSQMS